MRIVAELDTEAQWAAMWRELTAIGELGPREAELVADTARLGIAQNFAREQAPDGTPWHPLAAMTQAERRRGIDHRGVPFRTGAQHPILRRTDDLRDSFIDPRHPRNITGVGRWNGDTVIVLGARDDPQTPHRIANLHAGGVTEDGHVIPARPFVGLSDRAVRQLERQTRAILSQRLERVGT